MGIFSCRPAFFLFTIVALLWACTTKPEFPIEPIDSRTQQLYFPLRIGKYIEYQVDSIIYDFAPGNNILIDSSRTLFREEVIDTFRNNTNQLVFRIERFERHSDTLPWQATKVLAAVRTEKQAIHIENNLRFLKIVFPFNRNSNWNGNLWIDQYQEVEIAGERLQPYVNWHYEVDSLDIPASLGAYSFDSVLVVTEVNETNAIERRLSRSKYAKHIGLVWREQWILDSQYCNQIPAPNDCLTKPWAEKAEVGYILRQVITGYN